MKKLFTSLAVCLVLSFLMVHCSEQDEPQNIEVIQAELDAFIKAEMKKSDGPMTPKIMDFLVKRGFIPITEEMPEYQEMQKMSKNKCEEDNIKMFKLRSSNDISLSDMARIASSGCEVTGSGAMNAGGGCWVAVWEYSNGCYHGGCVGNQWDCGNGWSDLVYYC